MLPQTIGSHNHSILTLILWPVQDTEIDIQGIKKGHEGREGAYTKERNILHEAEYLEEIPHQTRRRKETRGQTSITGVKKEESFLVSIPQSGNKIRKFG
jgi:hypothetical protein